MNETTHRRPGSDGEHRRQRERDTTARAEAFYDQQVLAHLSEPMAEFLGRAELVVIATSDAAGECDSSIRCGPAGFVVVLDSTHLAYPEYRGNGVMASLGNLAENPHLGLLALDLVDDVIGLHVNGSASVVEDDELRREHPDLPRDPVRGRRAECWVVLEVEEAYVHCRKHLPRYARADRRRSWGTDDPVRKGGDHFDAAAEPRPWVG